MSEIKIPDISTLQRIGSISELSEGHLIALANQLKLSNAKSGELLIKVGSTEKATLFVIKGKVSLAASDDKIRIVSVDENEELKPIARLRPCIYDVRAVGAVTYLKIDMKLLSEFMQFAELPADDISVHSLFSDFDDEDNSLLNHLYRNLMDNSIKLPSLPSVAGRIQQIYKGRSTDADAMLHILISYPDISKKIINIARFAEKTELRRTEKIRNSIRRLGMRSVYCLVMTYSVGKLVKRLPENHMHRVSSFWEHSLSVAAISRVLAKQCTEFPPDLAMLAGLVHGIGVLAIDDRLLEHHPLKLDHIEIDHAIQVMRPEISGLLLRKWNFSDDLICVAEECGDWSREHEGPADLCDLVLIANYYGLMKSDKNHSLPRAKTIPSIKKLGITPEMSINAIRESTIVVRNIKKLFT